MNKIIVFILMLFLLACPKVNAQKKKAKDVESVEQLQVSAKPTIMVIPYVSGTEDLRTVLEADVNKRLVLSKIKESFDNAGYTTIDFVARLKAISNNSVFTEGNQKDIKALIVENSGADIYVEAEMVIKGNSVKIILTAYDTSTGESLSNVTGDSGSFPGFNDIGRLGQTAIENCRAQFLGTLQNKFNQMVIDGRSITMNIGIDEMSTYTMESEVGSESLMISDAIELWMEEHAYKGDFHIQGTTSKQMVLDLVRIPMVDKETGKPYNISRFGMDFFRYMRTLGVSISRNVKGNTLYITIK